MLSFYLSMIESEEDRHKFEIIYEKFHLLIYHTAHQLTNDEYMGEDIAQEAFLKLVENIKTWRYDNDKEFASLIVIVTKHCGYKCLNMYNKEISLDREMENGIDFSAESENYEKVVINSLTVHEVIEEIEKMDPRFSMPLKLSVMGYKSDEIARMLDISPRNVRIRIHRAKKKISEKLGGKYE